jgi:multidrug efflux system membrane fusion protein
VLLPLLIFTACSEEKKPLPQTQIRPVSTIVARKKPAQITRTFSGKAQNSQSSVLSFRVSGQIEYLPIDVGSTVKKGQIIARLDPEDYKLKVKQASAEIRSIRSKYQQLANDFRRMRKLYTDEVISKSKFDEVKSAYNSTAANLEAAREALQIARRNLSFTKLQAPASGTINQIQVENYQNISPGQPIATLISGAKTEVEVGIPDKLIYAIQSGSKAKVHFNALPGKVFQATVTEISMLASPMSTYPVIVALDNPISAIRPGMSALVDFSFKTKQKSSFFLPLQAVAREPYEHKFIWIVDPETSKVVKRKVKTGIIKQDKIQILSGLTEGERVVLRGVHRLQPGTKVKVLQTDRF